MLAKKKRTSGPSGLNQQADRLARGERPVGVSWVEGDVRDALDAIVEITRESRRGALSRIILEAFDNLPKK
jgi:hypothetical protein